MGLAQTVTAVPEKQGCFFTQPGAVRLGEQAAGKRRLAHCERDTMIAHLPCDAHHVVRT